MNAPETPPRRMSWRWPLMLSFAFHALLVFLFSIMPEMEPPTSAPVISEWEVPDSEMDYVVMDIYDRAVPVQPTVVGMPPALVAPAKAAEVASPAPTPQVAPPQVNSAPSAGPSTSGDTPGNSSTGATATADSKGSVHGAEGGTSFFQVSTSAHSIVYVIDRSGSMGLGGRLSRAQQELEASLDRLPETTQFQVIGYNRRADFLRIADDTGLLPATAANKQTALRWLKSLLPEGATDHMAALKQALLLAPDVIYFLTDAGDLKPEQVHALTQLNHGRSAIHTIELTPNQRSDTPLEELATSNHGKYQAVGAN